MKILLIDQTAAFLDFAMRCEADGHEVRWFLGPDKDGSRSNVGDGLAAKVRDWRPSMKWAELILVSDNCKYIHELESYRAKGFPIFGPHLSGTEWELDRMCGQRLLEREGIECLPAVEFTSFKEAEAFQLQHMDKRFVCKPCADVDKSLSYVSKSPADMLYMLDKWRRTIPKPPPFIFQEFFKGCEFAVGGWVGRNGFSKWFCESFEHKKLMNCEKGPNTGEMGTVIKYVSAEDSTLAQEMLLPLEAELIRSGYTGYIDVAVMIDKRGRVRPLEFTSRPGWPLFNIQQILHRDSAQWMLDLVNGYDTFEPYLDVAVGVVVAMPDFPFNKLSREDLSGVPVWGISDKNRFYIHPSEMKLGEGFNDRGVREPMLVSAGNYLMVVSGCAPTVEAAKEDCYKTVGQLIIPNSPMYRTDIGDRLKEELPLLQANGYALAWEW